MINAFLEGGIGMIPTLIFGLLLLGVAVRYAVSPEARVVPLLLSLGVLTLVAGMLGFVMGVITTMHAIAQMPPEQHWIAMLGVGESLQNLALALTLGALAALATSVGTFRLARTATT